MLRHLLIILFTLSYISANGQERISDIYYEWYNDYDKDIVKCGVHNTYVMSNLHHSIMLRAFQDGEMKWSKIVGQDLIESEIKDYHFTIDEDQEESLIIFSRSEIYHYDISSANLQAVVDLDAEGLEYMGLGKVKGNHIFFRASSGVEYCYYKYDESEGLLVKYEDYCSEELYDKKMAINGSYFYFMEKDYSTFTVINLENDLSSVLFSGDRYQYTFDTASSILTDKKQKSYFHIDGSKVDTLNCLMDKDVHSIKVNGDEIYCIPISSEDTSYFKIYDRKNCTLTDSFPIMNNSKHKYPLKHRYEDKVVLLATWHQGNKYAYFPKDKKFIKLNYSEPTTSFYNPRIIDNTLYFNTGISPGEYPPSYKCKFIRLDLSSHEEIEIPFVVGDPYYHLSQCSRMDSDTFHILAKNHQHSFYMEYSHATNRVISRINVSVNKNLGLTYSKNKSYKTSDKLYLRSTTGIYVVTSDDTRLLSDFTMHAGSSNWVYKDGFINFFVGRSDSTYLCRINTETEAFTAQYRPEIEKWRYVFRIGENFIFREEKTGIFNLKNDRYTPIITPESNSNPYIYITILTMKSCLPVKMSFS